MGQIVSGTIKFGRTVKTGDYENKRGDVELTFSVAEGEDPAATLDAVSREAHDRLNKILGIRVAGAPAPAATPITSVSTVQIPVASAPGRTKADIEKEVTAAATPKKGPGRPPKPPAPTAAGPAPKPANDPLAIEPVEPVDPIEDLGGPAQTVITDKELSDAANRANTKTAGKNVTAIRALNAKYGGGPVPKGLRDMPQGNRAAYLEELAKI
jgi:hypothetical protein